MLSLSLTTSAGWGVAVRDVSRSIRDTAGGEGGVF